MFFWCRIVSFNEFPPNFPQIPPKSPQFPKQFLKLPMKFGLKTFCENVPNFSAFKALEGLESASEPFHGRQERSPSTPQSIPMLPKTPLAVLRLPPSAIISSARISSHPSTRRLETTSFFPKWHLLLRWHLPTVVYCMSLVSPASGKSFLPFSAVATNAKTNKH